MDELCVVFGLHFSENKKKIIEYSRRRLTKAKGSWSRDGSRLNWCGGVESGHQQAIKWNTG